MDSNSMTLILCATLLAACGTSSSSSGTDGVGSSGETSSTGEEASTTGAETDSRGSFDTSSSSGTTGELGSDASTDTGSTTTGGETPELPDVDDGAHFRGVVTLGDGSVLNFDAVPETSVNPVNDLHFCTADATVDGYDIDVALSWPDTAALVLAEQPWALISTDGPVLRVGVDGPAGDETSQSNAGSVTFVSNGNDDPPSVAGVATIDLDPADDGDLLSSMTEIEFRCIL